MTERSGGLRVQWGTEFRTQNADNVPRQRERKDFCRPAHHGGAFKEMLKGRRVKAPPEGTRALGATARRDRGRDRADPAFHP